jgi:cytoskeleton protein RodZ
MSITGKAPFNVTLGKPELVAIKFNDNVINMSQFNRGNIAKFSLPLK